LAIDNFSRPIYLTSRATLDRRDSGINDRMIG